MRKEIWFALSLYIEIASRWIEVFIEICWALNLNRNESNEVLSSIYWWQKHLDGSRICWESIGQTKGERRKKEKEAVEDKEGLNRRESVEDMLKSCWAWRKQVFQEGKNTLRWMQQASYSNIDPINILSSQNIS